MARPCKQANEFPVLADFGKAVRAERMRQNISQEALADLAGLDRSYMGGVERGENNVALINIWKISKALNVAIADLMALAKV